MAAKKEPENAVNEAGTEKTYRMEDVRAMVAAMLAEEKAKAAEAEAEAEIQAKAQREQDAARMEELVEIKLFKDNGKYKDDVFVSVNGETIAIKRGERVKIKRKFAEVLENSDHQDQETARLIEEKSSEGRKAWAEMDK